MANYFENLKNLFVEKLFPKSKKNYDNEDYNSDEKVKLKMNERRNTDQEETISLLEDQVRITKFHKIQQVDKTYNAVVLFSAKRLAYIYGFFGVFTVTFMLFCCFRNPVPQELFTEIGPMKTKFLSFFDLPKINFLVYHMLNTITGLLGLAIVISVYMGMHMKFSSSKSHKFQFVKLYLSTAYGLISNFIHIIYGASFFMQRIDKLNQTVKTEIHISIYQFFLFIEVFFTILFGIFSTFLVYDVKSKPSYSISSEEQAESEKEMKWVNYKILNIIYLVFFTLAYLLVILHTNNIILVNFNSPIIKANYSYLLAIFPYLLYFLNLCLYLTFYDEIKDANISLVEPTEKVTLDNNQRNIL